MACSSTLPGGVLYPSWRGRGARGAPWQRRRTGPPPTGLLLVRAVSAPEDCNEESCAPEKEVGKVSMEWKAMESTQVVGTFPPVSKKKWTGFVEKDTAGQTNIYAVEPTVYVSENAISSNTAGDSSEGSEQTLLVAAGLALGLLVGAGLVLRIVSTSPSSAPVPDAANLSYYIQKFSPVTATTTTTIETAAVAPELQSLPSEQPPSPIAADIPAGQPVVPVGQSTP